MFTTRNIILVSNHEKENFYCSLCNYPLMTAEDFESDENYQCCNECYLTFIEGRRSEWKNGWRPEKTAVRDYILLKNRNNSKEIK